METREYRALDDKSRQFAMMYGMNVSAFRNYGLTPVQFFAAHFAGLLKIEKHDFIYCMQMVGKKLLTFYNIDCRTPAERVRSQFAQIQRRDDEIV